MPLYNGFSTINRSKKYRLSDFELAKQNLYNHLRIRKGEKLMNPNFGTIIWDLLHDQLTDEVKNAIVTDVKNVINYDPRIAAEAIDVIEFNNGIQLVISLVYIQTDQRDTLKVTFDANAQI